MFEQLFQFYNQMGNQCVSNLKEQKGNFQFYQIIKDRKYGKIKIYKKIKNSYPYLYSMKIQKFNDLAKTFELFTSLKQNNNQQAEILHIKNMENQTCQHMPSVQIFFNYFNIYLEDLIINKQFNVTSQLKKKKFSENQIWYLIKNAINSSLTLLEYHLFFEFSSKSIAVTPDLFVKFAFAQLESYNMHRSYYKIILFKQVIKSYYSPEQLELLKNKYQQLIRRISSELNHEKCSVFSLGLVVLEMVLRKKMHFLYNYQLFTFNSLLLKEIIIELLDKNLVSIELYNFLVNSLALYQYRYSFSQLNKEFKSIFKNYNSLIQLAESRRNQLKLQNTISGALFKQHSDQSQLQNNLQSNKHQIIKYQQQI